jgi:hypothetical protein
VTLGPLTVGDDPERGLDPAHRADRIAAARLAVGVRTPAQVDDRHVEAADVADQLERLPAIARLVDLEFRLERFAQADPDQRMPVDDKAMWAFAQGRFRSVGVLKMDSAARPRGAAFDPNGSPVRPVR